MQGLAVGFVAAGLASAWIVAVQLSGMDIGPLALHVATVPTGHAPFANLGQPNQLADLLALALVGVFIQFERRRVAPAVAVAAAVVLVLALAATQSRTVLLFFAVSLIWHLLCRARVPMRTPLLAVLAMGSAWAALFLAWPRIIEAAGMSTPVLATTAERLQAGPRTVIWSQMFDAIWLRPWFGFGWNQVGVAQVAVAADHPASRMVEHSHNLLIDLALWNGVPLALLIIMVAGVWVMRAMRRVRTLEGAAALLMICLLLAHSLVEFPLEYLYFLVPFSIALGVVAAEVGGWSALMVPRRWGMAALAGFTLVAAWAAVDYWGVEQAYRDMRYTVARIGGPMSSRTPPPLDTQFTQLDAFYRFALTPVETGMSPEKIEWMRRVAHRYAYASALHRYGVVQALNGDLPGARLTFSQLRQLHGERRYGEAKAEIDDVLSLQYPVLKRLRLP